MLDPNSNDWLDNLVRSKLETLLELEWSGSKNSYLLIELFQFDFPLVFNERSYPNVQLRKLGQHTVFDSELFKENPIENKHRKLARSHRTGPMDRELKPNAKIRDDFNVKST